MRRSLREEAVLIISTILTSVIFVWLMFFYKQYPHYFLAEDHSILFIFTLLFLYFTDNISIRYQGFLGKKGGKYYKIRLITNAIGFLPLLVIFGPRMSNIALIITRLLRFNEESKDSLLLRKIRGAVYYFIQYSISSIVYDKFVNLNFLLALLLFVFTFKSLNIFLFHIENPRDASLKERLYGISNDLPLFLMNIPSVYIINEIYYFPEDYISIFITLGYYFSCVVLFLYWLTTKYKSNYNRTLIEHEKLLNIKSGLENILQIFKTIKSNKPLDLFFKDIARILAEFFECKYVLINIFNYEKRIAERVACYGIDENEFEKLKKDPPTIDEVRDFFKPEFKIGNSYFIPEEANKKLDRNKVFMGKYETGTDEYSWKPFDLFLIPLRDVNGGMIGYVSLDGPINGKRPTVEQVKVLEIFMEQIASFFESSKEYSKILNKALTDGLTGLYNHSYFYNCLEKMIRMSLERGKEFSIIVLDLDDFKKINDRYGHLFGDMVLKKVAMVIKSSMRDLDIICRYGGDEFVVVLPNVSKRFAREIAERLLIRIRKTEFENDIYLTASIGVSSFPDDGNNATELFEVADRALYVSKTLGKNTITA
ncbi:MAG TPA: GGDEF domain-containing protein [Thermotogaceae bacterium]|nr:GGDEF domain-containing protein [Thermotogaceae bacterium]